MVRRVGEEVDIAEGWIDQKPKCCALERRSGWIAHDVVIRLVNFVSTSSSHQFKLSERFCNLISMLNIRNSTIPKGPIRVYILTFDTSKAPGSSAGKRPYSPREQRLEQYPMNFQLYWI